MSNPQALFNLTFTDNLIAGFAAYGIEFAVLSPGSRSTPLAVSLWRCPSIKTTINIDERSAAFVALGMAKYSGKSVLLVCTSGSAVAHYLPALIEARQSAIPLIVLTADRPPELQGCGAPQTINQKNIYGYYAKRYWQVDVIPQQHPQLPNEAKNYAQQAVEVSQQLPKGAVHINIGLREPLVPNQWPPFTQSVEGTTPIPFEQPPTEIPTSVLKILEHATYGWIICGPLEVAQDAMFSAALAALEQATGFLLIADSASSQRLPSKKAVSSMDILLRQEQLAGGQPDVIIQFGQQPASKQLSHYLQNYSGKRIVISNTPEIVDPSKTAFFHIQGQLSTICNCLLKRLPSQTKTQLNFAKQTALREADKQCQQAITKLLAPSSPFSEPAIARSVLEHLPAGAQLFVGSSMPIRDLDYFGGIPKHAITIYANRGANGIDGNIATALGIAQASTRPTYALIGDLAFIHDLNTLSCLNQQAVDLTIIVINNHGGHIFDHLPIAQVAPNDFLTQYFTTPQQLDIAMQTKAFGLNYTRVDKQEQLPPALAQPGRQIIECIVDSQYSWSIRQTLWAHV